MNEQEIQNYIATFTERIRQAHILDLSDSEHLPPGTHVVIASDDATWVDLEIVENRSGKVMLHDGHGNSIPASGEVLGSLRLGVLAVDYAERGILKDATILQRADLLHLKVKFGEVFVYKVGSQYRVINGAVDLILKLKSGRTLDVWEDQFP